MARIKSGKRNLRFSKRSVPKLHSSVVLCRVVERDRDVHTCIHTLHYITLHCITLHYIALHCIALHYITLHYITLHYITLHYITLHYIHTYIHTGDTHTHTNGHFGIPKFDYYLLATYILRSLNFISEQGIIEKRSNT